MEGRAELGGCGKVTGAVGTDSVKTGGVVNTGPRKFKAEEVVDEELGKLTVVAERTSGKNEDVEPAGATDGAMSK